MQYVFLEASSSHLALGSRLAIRSNSTRQARDSDTNAASTDFDESIDCRICRPESISVSDDGLTVVRVGFVIAVAKQIQIQWLRFKLTFVGGDQNVAAVFPSCVSRPMAFQGRVAVGDCGELTWPARETNRADVALTFFTPSVIGHRIGASSVFWDFHPWDREVPQGTDKLILSLRTKPAKNVQLTASVLLGVSVSGQSEAYLQLTESLEVDINGRAG